LLEKLPTLIISQDFVGRTWPVCVPFVPHDSDCFIDARFFAHHIIDINLHCFDQRQRVAWQCEALSWQILHRLPDLDHLFGFCLCNGPDIEFEAATTGSHPIIDHDDEAGLKHSAARRCHVQVSLRWRCARRKVQIVDSSALISSHLCVLND